MKNLSTRLGNDPLLSAVIAGAVAGAVAGALTASLISGGSAGPGTKPESGMETAAETFVEASPATKKKGYAKGHTYFDLPGHKGGRLDLADHAGKPVMLMFFTETCPYCRKAAPFVQKLHEKYARKGLSVLAAAQEREAAPAARFVKDFGITFPVAYDAAPVARAYKTRGVPYLFLLDREHKVYDLWAGYDPSFDEDIRKSVEEVLKP